MLHRPELLSPAGSLRNQRYAFAYGADAVYAGLPRYSLRVRNNDFNAANLAIGITEAHAQGKRFYLATNLMPHGAKIRTFVTDLAPIIALKPDALIVADPGILLLIREHWPEQSIHLSVQANTVNAEAVRFWAKQGVERVILSRELSLDEIADIRAACPDIELEVFIHGALCIAYSGRCLLSGYFNHRDANQGSCTNSCRWQYRLKNAEPNVEHHHAVDAVYLLEEGKRPGELMPIFEDEHGTYILNSRDLQAVAHIERLVAIGIDCLKIEGRTKSHYYVARTAQVYRAAIDDALAGRTYRPELLSDLEGLSNRGYTEGFYQRHSASELQNYADGASRNHRRIFVGELNERDDTTEWVKVTVKNRFAVGDYLELITPKENQLFQLTQMQTLDGEVLLIAPGSGWQVRILLPDIDAQNGLLTRVLDHTS
ncbi:tRNA 5-hydroxyuridine modification protein YegQ [Chromatium okenii]|uniref:prephenate-dependent tRNA uridine(34) hydroxylase TrhP n=1 Tax=Chromatium okenii TaxID=61644 RepID=UPI0026EE94F7|nr:tRNA 5-hydroxyuridine modification protein YegQ [Chromatium okenii]MBV5308294.1 tRNA 5-hydroxyuridine modification protein YegQ [Chromatium okenii]